MHVARMVERWLSMQEARIDRYPCISIKFLFFANIMFEDLINPITDTLGRGAGEGYFLGRKMQASFWLLSVHEGRQN